MSEFTSDPRLSPTDLLVKLANDITDESERWARDALIALIATTLHSHLHAIVECAVDYFLTPTVPEPLALDRATLCAQIEARCLRVIEQTRQERLAREEREETDNTNNHDVA